MKRYRLLALSAGALLATGGLVAGLVLSLGGWPGSAAPGGTSPTTAQPTPTTRIPTAPHVVHIDLVGKIDATSGKRGTFTGKPGWPALAPSNIIVPAGATVVLTIKEYDDMVTPLPTMGMMGSSPFNEVRGGTETVDGKPVTWVSNARIAHTFTVPQLGINVPLPAAPHRGFTEVEFTFRAPSSPGTYTWQCETPCGTGPGGMGGAMVTYGWMRGHFTVD